MVYMKARITFRSEVYINGANIADIKDKFENLGIFSGTALEDCFAEFVEYATIEDAETNEDLTSEYNNAKYEDTLEYKLEKIWGAVEATDEKCIEFKTIPIAPCIMEDGSQYYCPVKMLWIDEEYGDCAMVHDGVSDWVFVDDNYTHEGLDNIINALIEEGFIEE